MSPEQMPSEDEEEQRLAFELVETGGELAGAAVGRALGTIGGPVGVAAGAAGGVLVTRVLKRVGADIQRRILGPRQHAAHGTASERSSGHG